MRNKAADQNRYRSYVLWAMSLAVAASGLLAGCSPVEEGQAEGLEQPQSVGRLNKVIERAERGELNFMGESWQYLPDQEHDLFGLLKLGDAMAALRPEGSEHPLRTPIVRIGMEANFLEKHRVKQYLDAGLMGLILPQSETPEQVYEFIRMMRYPPQGSHYSEEPVGSRGMSPSSAAIRYWGVDIDTYMRKADVWPLNPEGELLAIVLVETKSQVEHIEELLEVPGLGAILVGLSDMSMSYGVGTPAPNWEAPELKAAIASVARACGEHHRMGGKVICGRYQMPEGLEASIDAGFTMFTSGRGDYRGDLP